MNCPSPNVGNAPLLTPWYKITLPSLRTCIVRLHIYPSYAKFTELRIINSTLHSIHCCNIRETKIKKNKQTIAISKIRQRKNSLKELGHIHIHWKRSKKTIIQLLKDTNIKIAFLARNTNENKLKITIIIVTSWIRRIACSGPESCYVSLHHLLGLPMSRLPDGRYLWSWSGMRVWRSLATHEYNNTDVYELRCLNSALKSTGQIGRIFYAKCKEYF